MVHGYPKLGILAGGGTIPVRLIEACKEQNRPFFVVALDGHADAPEMNAVPHIRARIGSVGTILARLRDEGCEQVVMVGRVKRPSLTSLFPDARGAAFIAKIGIKALGDDGLLKLIAEELEAEGFQLVGAHQVAPKLLVREGVIGRLSPDEQASRDIALGLKVAKHLGAVDVGQGCVVQQGLVLAVEAIEGTDAMVKRAGELKRKGLGGVLIKTSKPQQEARLDLPTIGPKTVAAAKEAGLRGIAIEAGAALFVDQEDAVRVADRAGLFLIGVSPEYGA